MYFCDHCMGDQGVQEANMQSVGNRGGFRGWLCFRLPILYYLYQLNILPCYKQGVISRSFSWSEEENFLCWGSVQTFGQRVQLIWDCEFLFFGPYYFMQQWGYLCCWRGEEFGFYVALASGKYPQRTSCVYMGLTV